MKIAWFTILSLIFTTCAYSQNGQWQSAWQNDHNLCTPRTITISIRSQNEGTVKYDYSFYRPNDFCPPELHEGISYNITFDPNSKTWHDTSGSQIVYNADTNSLMFLINGTSFWFQPAKTGISQEFIKGALSGYWDYQELTGLDTVSSSCQTDRLLFFSDYDRSNNYRPRFTYNEYYITHPNCSGVITNKALYPHGSNLTTIRLVDDIVSPTITILFTPSLSSTTLTLIKFTNSSRNLTFTRSTNFTPIQGYWIRDWQSNLEYLPRYSIEIISRGNVQYMQSGYLNGCRFTTGFVVEVSPGNYYDPSLNETFTYDKSTHTLRTKAGLYSNGSLFDTVPFARLWGFPEVVGGSEYCCLPTYVHIAHNEQKTNLAHHLGGPSVLTEQSNLLIVTYVLTGDYLTNPRCQEINVEVQDGFIETTISVIRPSISQVIWTDKFNNTISFADATSSSQILVSFFNQCSFTMIPLSPPAPLPKWIPKRTYYEIGMDDNAM